MEPTKEQPQRAPACIQIVEDDQTTVPWQYRDDETGQLSESILHLRVLNDDAVEEIRKKHSTRQRIFNPKTRGYDWDEQLQSQAYVEDILDAGILNWERVKSFGTQTDLPCERRFKVRLPERVKLQALRVIVGKEVADALLGTNGDGEVSPAESSKKRSGRTSTGS